MNTLRQTGLLIQWQLRRGASSLPLMILVQSLLAVGTIVGFGFLIGDVDPAAALFLATGAPTVTLVMVGLVMTPQTVAEEKREGSIDWKHTLPVPRALFLVADLAMWTVIALPGLVLALLVAMWRYGISFSFSPWLLFGVIIVSLTAASVGYAVATLLPPMVAMLISQLLVFVILLFTPISFPPDRMPSWLQSAHEWLPFQPMGDVIRGGLASGAYPIPTAAIVTLTIWCVLAVAGAAAVLVRRR